MSRPAVLFGPYGTALEERGSKEGISDLHVPTKVLQGGVYREAVLDVARRYAQHAQVATTNTFGLRALLRHGEPELYREAVLAHHAVVLEAIRGSANVRSLYVALGPYGVSNGGCYNPDEAPATSAESKDFHEQQLSVVKDLPDVGPALFETVCTVREAVGIVWAARRAGLSVVVSFVVDRVGQLLGGENLADAIRQVDEASGSYPDFYALNCCPLEGLFAGFDASNGQRHRIGLAYPNASSRDPRGLEEEGGIVRDFAPDESAGHLTELAALNDQIQVVGGCCGFDHEAIRVLSEAVVARSNAQIS